MVSELVNVWKLEFLRPWLKVIIFFVLLSDHPVKWLLSNYFLFQLSGFDHKARVELRLPSSPVRPSQLQGEDHFLEALRSPQGKPLNWWNGELGEFHWWLDFFLPSFWKGYLIFVVSTLFIIVHKFFLNPLIVCKKLGLKSWKSTAF
jgi:hypothetical protein